MIRYDFPKLKPEEKKHVFFFDTNRWIAGYFILGSNRQDPILLIDQFEMFRPLTQWIAVEDLCWHVNGPSPDISAAVAVRMFDSDHNISYSAGSALMGKILTLSGTPDVAAHWAVVPNPRRLNPPDCLLDLN